MRYLGQLKDALELHNQALKKKRTIFSGNTVEIANSYNNIAIV